MNYIEILDKAFTDNARSTEMDIYHAQTILRELCFKSISDSFTLLMRLCGKKTLITLDVPLVDKLCCLIKMILIRSEFIMRRPNRVKHTTQPSLGQNGRRFADDIFSCIFMNEKFCILVRISLKFVPKGPIDNNPVLVHIIAWPQIGAKPLPEPMLTWLTDTYTGLGGDELKTCITKTSGRHHFQIIVIW